MKPVKKKTSLAKQVKDGFTHTSHVSCHTTHLPMTIGKYKIYGGSCSYPNIKDADVYVGFCHSMNVTGYPWEGVTEVLFEIPDRGIPENLTDFKNMLEWIKSQLIASRRVHIGCIGGHGRTGTVLAALVRFMDPSIKDAIGYVRKNYCKKAVESQKQIDFLVKEFGCTPAPARDLVYPKATKSFDTLGYLPANMPKEYNDWIEPDISFGGPSLCFDPVPSKKNIWKKTEVLTKQKP